METGVGSPPPPEDARQTLRQLGGDEDAVRYPLLPSWFFLVMATIVAGLALAQLLPPSDSSSVSLALAVVALVPAHRYWLNRDGVSWTTLKVTDMITFLLGVLGTFALSAVLVEVTGTQWIWIIGAVVVAGTVMQTGRAYRREFGA